MHKEILNQSNPAGFSAHILGNEVLKRFNTVLDFKKDDIYFQKNTLIDLTYSDAQK